MFNFIRFFVAVIFFTIVLFVNDVSADKARHPQNFITTTTEFFPMRPLAIVTVKNSSNRDLNVVLKAHENSSLGSSVFRRILVPAKSEMPVELTFDYSDQTEPNQRFFLFHLDVAFIIGRDKIDAEPVYQLIEKVGNEYVLTNEETYMRKNLKPVLVGGRAYTGTAQIDRGAGLVETITPPVNTFFMSSENELNVDINNLPRVEQIRGLAPKEFANMLPLGHLPKFTAPGRTKPSIATALNFNFTKPDYTESLGCAPGSQGCRSGFLMYSAFFGFKKWAGWGFTVELWSFEKLTPMDPNPQWKMIGSTEVEPNGLWAITPQYGYNAESLKMYVYRMGNRFVQMMNPVNVDKNYFATPYTWSEFVQPKKVNGIWTEKYFFAKTLPLTPQGGIGLGTMFHASMKLWSKMALGQINPLSGFAYKIHYPNKLTNLTKNCIYADPPDNVPYAWSCSVGSFGNIWIIPAHADLETVVHELGHSINRTFWGKGNWPSEGGSHSFSGCYSAGLALTEGWADFLPYWVKFSSTEKNPIIASFNVDIERHSLKCADATKFNEMSVAATFWDLYDKVDETPELTRYDIVNYDQDIGSVAEYLQTPQTSITSFRNKVMGKSPIDIQKLIYDMFSLNYTMIQN